MKFLQYPTLLLLLLAFAQPGYSTGLKIDDIDYKSENGTVSFHLSWNNAWKNSKNNDAAWVFVKIINAGTALTHGVLAQSGHSINSSSGPDGEILISNDAIGVFTQPANQYRGNVSWDVVLKLNRPTVSQIKDETEVKVYGLEMVYIPEGSFYLGGKDQKAIDYAGFYKSDGDGEPNGNYRITAENEEIKVQPSQDNLYYKTGDSEYRGDQRGDVPSVYPKGFNAFYIMKYETTQGFYADFLNSLPPQIAKTLSPHTTEKYYESRGSIRVNDGQYIADSPDRPANYITWDDGMSLADWSGLRPMTELEFTKAARGPEIPTKHEFPWGTDNTDDLKRHVTEDDELTNLDGLTESNLNDENRASFGASYYWIMDLAGSLWEKCVTIGHPKGRSFIGTHGDGKLSSEGQATNDDWPAGIEEQGGYGYRGGGYYNHGMRISDYNPHSPIAYRPYGSWAGGDRSIAYSQRLVRTAPR